MTSIESLLSLLNETGGKITIEVEPGFLSRQAPTTFEELREKLLRDHEDKLDASDRMLLVRQWLTTRQVAEYFEIEDAKPLRKVVQHCQKGELFHKRDQAKNHYLDCSASCVMRMIGVERLG